MPQFAFLLPHHPTRYTSLTEEEFMPVMKDYIGWVESATEAGVFVDGHKLSEAGTTVAVSDDGLAVQDLAAVESAEILAEILHPEITDYGHYKTAWEKY